jgi:excinuclease ABC A subunit
LTRSDKKRREYLRKIFYAHFQGGAMENTIKVTGARIHNLKNIDIEIPKGKLTVITGVSGSGKSSFAFDTLYEEGKRRYLMFSDAQFVVDNVPTFENITGLSPTVAVEQRIIRQSNPRSTVGTRTKIEPMLAALFSAYGSRNPEYDDGLHLTMEMFQKNSPRGMCVRCIGAGHIYVVDEDAMFGDKNMPLHMNFGGKHDDYGTRGNPNGISHSIRGFCVRYGLSPIQSIGSLDENLFLKYKYGDADFEGIVPFMITQFKDGKIRKSWNPAVMTFVKKIICPKCKGTALNEYAVNTTINGKNIAQLQDMYIRDLHNFLKNSKLKDSNLLGEILIKLACMINVGLHHLALSRPVPTLSGGEIQRLFLASYIIAEMDSIIFVFDEPTIGLHEVEKQKLIEIIQNLIRRGNTVIAVEHDINFMQAADYIIDLGPRAGEYGGERIFQGSYADFMKCDNSLTAPYLSGKLSMPLKINYKPVNKAKILRLDNCNIHNLRNISVEIPLGLLVGVAGVSGSGKSSIISDTLVPKLKEVLKSRFISNEDNTAAILPSVQISGTEHIKKCAIIDQKPIGRNRNSCPATYTGIFDRIRKMFSESPEATAQGYEPGMFSNHTYSDGTCPICKGSGVIQYPIGFNNCIDVDCEHCNTTGFKPEALTITVDGKNIHNILEMSISNALEYFEGKDKVTCRMLKMLDSVGLGYMSLGQRTPTISGGEAQRIKLAKELGKSNIGKDNVYILDEPTTGLSFSDSKKLLELMQKLVDNGNTVIVTEHDPVILSHCDYIIEMGRGGGSDGGNIIATGTPEYLKQNKKSIIGAYLK